MDKYIKQQVILSAAKPTLDLGVLPYLGKVQITVVPCTLEGVQVDDGTVTGNVDIQAYPFGNNQPDATYLKTFDASQGSTQTFSGYFDAITATIKTQGTAQAFLVSMLNA